MLLAREDRPVLIACGNSTTFQSQECALSSEILRHLLMRLLRANWGAGSACWQIEPFRQQWGLLGRDVEVAAVK